MGMPQSLSRIVVHVIFSTKHRIPSLAAEVRPDLHAYLATVARNTGCECYRVGGVEDHVHLAARLSRTTASCKFVEQVKAVSSKWLKNQTPGLKEFSWQRGYAAFSVGADHIDSLCRYIDRQVEHHRKLSFQDEYRGLLKEHGIQYDDRYMWD
jgi:REP element-mobilizing transposase RayT